MFLELFLGVMLLACAIFGAYCAIKTLSEALFSSDRITVALEIRERRDADELDMLLREAQSTSLRRGRTRVVVLLSSDLMDGTVGEGDKLYDGYADLLDRFGAECYLIDP